MTDTAYRPAYRHALRVYWEDTDAGGVVYYANYLRYFERARTDWLRALGVSQSLLRDETEAIFVVSESTVRYLSPARLDDQLEITVELRELGRASMLLHQKAMRDHRAVAEADIRVGCVDAGTFRPRRIPSQVIERIG